LYADLWLDTEKFNQYGKIDRDMIAKFRDGSFNDQPENVKQAFLFCMLTLLPTISREWKRKEVHVHHSLSTKISRSDESLLYWFLDLYGDKWIAEYKEEQNYQQQNNGNRLPKRQKGGGQHYSRVYLFKYNNMKAQLKDKWMNETTGKGWDQAVQLEAKRLHDLEQDNGGQGNNPLNDLPQAETEQSHSYPGVDFGEYEIEEFVEV
jgi:hypothetical protein